MSVSLLTPLMRRNFRHLYLDIFWYGVLGGSALAFISIYAARLGADTLQISLLTAGPAAVNLVFSLPAGRWLEGRSLIRATFLSSALHRLGYLLLIPLPWLLGDQAQIWVIILITLLMSIPGTLLAIGFNATLADVVPPEWRGEVVGKRNAIMAVSLTGASLLSGWLLDQIQYPFNYQVVFFIGALGAAMSTYHLGQLRAERPVSLARAGKTIGDLARPGLGRSGDALRTPTGLRFLTRAKGKSLLQFDLLRGPFGAFMGACLIFYFAQYLPIPLFPLVFVNQLQLTEGQISLGSALFFVAMLLVSLQLGRISARYGHRRSMLAGSLLYGLYPLIIGLAGGAPLYWLASFIGGGVWAVTGASLSNRLMERVPENGRPAYMALHNLVLNLGILAGSLAAPALSSQLGLQQAVLVGAFLRFLAALFLARWG